MMTAEELVLVLDDTKEENNFKLATVVDLFKNNTAKIKFDGEDIPSEKQYAYLKSYIPEVGDRILLAAMGGTYIILGRVNFNESPDSEEEEIDRYLFDLKKVTILKGLEVSGAATFNNGMSVIGNVGINGSLTATGLSATGEVSGGSLLVSGNVNGGTANFSSLGVSGATDLKGSLDVSGTLNASRNLYVYGNLGHYGSALGFFGRTPTSRRTVSFLSGTPTVNSLQSKLNDLISALSAYGLINI